MSCSNIESFYFKPEIEMIAGEIVPPITESHKIQTEYPSVVERYFTKYFYCRNDNIEEAHLILHHSNRICLIGLNETHVAVRKGIQSINFDIGGIDRSKNHVSGKSKRGGINLQPTSCIAIVTCNDGTEYKIVSAINAKLVEVNERLLANPSLIGKDGDGYVAVVLPKIEKVADIIGGLLTEGQFKEKMEQKLSNVDSNKME